MGSYTKEKTAGIGSPVRNNSSNIKYPPSNYEEGFFKKVIIRIIYK